MFTRKMMPLLLIFASIICISGCNSRDAMESMPEHISDEYTVTSALSGDEEGVFVGVVRGEGIMCYLELKTEVTYTDINENTFSTFRIDFNGRESIKLESNCEIGKEIAVKGTVFNFRGDDNLRFSAYKILAASGQGHGNITPSELQNWNNLSDEDVAIKACQLLVAIMYRSGLYDSVDTRCNASLYQRNNIDGEECVLVPCTNVIYDGGNCNVDISVYRDRVEFYLNELDASLKWIYDWSGTLLSKSGGVNCSLPEYLKS